jgi:hypothetical protein
VLHLLLHGFFGEREPDHIDSLLHAKPSEVRGQFAWGAVALLLAVGDQEDELRTALPGQVARGPHQGVGKRRGAEGVDLLHLAQEALAIEWAEAHDELRIPTILLPAFADPLGVDA